MRYEYHRVPGVIRSSSAGTMIQIRRYHPQDGPLLLALFRDTIHRINTRDYSPEQIDAWASPDIDELVWTDRFTGRFAWVAEIDRVVAGFTDMTSEGFLDRLFVSADHQRKGVATALIDRLLNDAAAADIATIRTNASLTARPFFESRGFEAEARQTVDCRGVLMDNFRMKLELPPRQTPPIQPRRNDF